MRGFEIGIGCILNAEAAKVSQRAQRNTEKDTKGFKSRARTRIRISMQSANPKKNSGRIKIRETLLLGDPQRSDRFLRQPLLFVPLQRESPGVPACLGALLLSKQECWVKTKTGNF